MSKIKERLEKHVADFGLLYIKLHNYHWHIGGLDFKAIHELLEVHYNEIALSFDQIAERLLQLGGKAPASMSEYLKIASLKEETKKDFDSKYVISSVKSDFGFLVNELKETRIIAGDDNDSSTDSILSAIIESLEQHIWMLESMLK